MHLAFHQISLDSESQLFRDFMLITKRLRNGRLIIIMFLNSGMNAVDREQKENKIYLSTIQGIIFEEKIQCIHSVCINYLSNF